MIKVTGIKTAAITSVMEIDRPADLAHRFHCRFRGSRYVLIQFGMDGLHHDDGVIHHDADREHEGE